VLRWRVETELYHLKKFDLAIDISKSEYSRVGVIQLELVKFEQYILHTRREEAVVTTLPES